MKGSTTGLITVGSSKTLLLCYAAVTHILAKSFQESSRQRFEKRWLKISLPIFLILTSFLISESAWKRCFFHALFYFFSRCFTFFHALFPAGGPGLIKFFKYFKYFKYFILGRALIKYLNKVLIFFKYFKIINILY